MRCITVADHPGKSLDELVRIILDLGHDRYGPPIRLDLLLFYDPDKMEVAPWAWNKGLMDYVPASHIDNRPRSSEHLYWFREPENKPGALLSILKIRR